MHITIDSKCFVGVGVVSFWFKLEVGDEVVTAIYLSDTTHDVTVEEFECLAGNRYHLFFELWAARWQIIEFLVQLVRVFI